MRVESLKEEVLIGKRTSLYRDRKTIAMAKVEKKDWPNTWFLKGRTIGTISCIATPQGILKKRLNQAINDKNGPNILVIEDGGKPITAGLTTADPMREDGCIFKDDNCIVNRGDRCDKTGLVYKIHCVSCMEEVAEESKESHNYIGLTRTSVHSRMKTHLNDQRIKKSKSPLHRHDVEHHNGVQQQYVTNIVNSEKKIVRLYSLEALSIEKQDSKLSMNERNEGGRGGVVRITATRVTT